MAARPGAPARRAACRAVIAVVLGAASTLGVARARAADELVLANAHVAGYPRIELSVDAPRGAAALRPADVSVIEDGQPVEALVDRLAGEGLEVMLVIDTSSAVGADALAAAQAATTRLVDRMPVGVRVGLVAFGPDVRLLVAPTDARAAVGASIETLAGGGGGPVADAPVYDAVVAASRAFGAGARARMIVLFDAAGDVGSAATVDGAAVAVAGQHVEVVSLETPATSPLALARLAIEGRGDVRSAADAAGVGAAFDGVADAIVGRYSIAYTSRGHGTVDVRVVTLVGELHSRLELPAAPASGPTTAPSSPPTTAPTVGPTTVAPMVAPAVVVAPVETGAPEVRAIPAARRATAPPNDGGPSGGPPWTTIEALALGGLVLIVALRHLGARRVEALEMPVVDAPRWPPPLPDQVFHHPWPAAFVRDGDRLESEPELTGAR